MSKVFTYNKIINSVLLEGTDEYEEVAEEFEYEVQDNDLYEAVVDCIYSEFFKKTDLAYRVDYALAVKKGLLNFVKSCCDLEALVDDYEEELKEMFEELAIEEYNYEKK